jgi:hypothetical protein
MSVASGMPICIAARETPVSRVPFDNPRYSYRGSTYYLCLSRIFDNLFPLGLAAKVLGKVHHLAPLNHPDSRAGLKTDLQRSMCCASYAF